MTIKATQDASLNYNSGTINASFNIAKSNPTISNFSITRKTYGDASFNIIAPISNSNSAFTYDISNTSVATISGRTITIVGAGSATITATQSSNNNYNSGTITAIFDVAKATPILSNFYVPSNKPYGDPSFNINDPSSNSPEAFTYDSSNTSVATISGRTISIIGSGTTTITATQTSNDNYNSTNTSAVFYVSKATTNLSNFSITDKTYGQEISFNIIDPSSNSDASFTYDTSDNSIIDISGKNVTIKTAGNVTIKASQNSNTNYTSGTTTTTFNIAKAIALLNNLIIGGKTYGQDISFNITDPSSNSDASFTYDTSDNSIIDISGKKVTIKKAGNVTIKASQNSNTNYTSGTTTTIFNIAKANPILTNFIITRKTHGDARFNINDPSSNSPGAFTYTSSNSSVATISGKTITIIEAGSSTITATQDSTENYNSGTIDTSFNVFKNTEVTPVNISNESQIMYILSTNAIYCNLINDIYVTGQLRSNSKKIFSNNQPYRVNIRKIA